MPQSVVLWGRKQRIQIIEATHWQSLSLSYPFRVDRERTGTQGRRLRGQLLLTNPEGTKAHPALEGHRLPSESRRRVNHGGISTFSSVALASALLPKLTPSQAPSGSRHAYLRKFLDL